MDTEKYTTGTGQVINVHRHRNCKGGPCVIHSPSDHHMRDFPTHWREDRALMERICPHGIGHPDPDHMSHLLDNAPLKVWETYSIHGCDGCCHNKNRVQGPGQVGVLDGDNHDSPQG